VALRFFTHFRTRRMSGTTIADCRSALIFPGRRRRPGRSGVRARRSGGRRDGPGPLCSPTTVSPFADKCLDVIRRMVEGAG
jgi:hypothetical protein